jgi:hypothetical protein
MHNAYLSTDDLAKLSGCSYRQADYWTRNGVLTPTRPARGQGSKRGWTLDDVALARVFLVLSGLGAVGAVLAAVAIALDRDPWLWEGAVVVSADGRVRALEGSAGPGWVVDLAECRREVYGRFEADSADSAAAGVA